MKDHYLYWSKLGKHNSLFYREEKCLKILQKFKKNLKFLDVGCGDGLFLNHLKRQTKFELYGGDYSIPKVEKCRSKGLNVIKIDLEKKLPFKDNFFDIVYAGEVIEHLYDPDYAIKEISRIIKPDGYFLLSTPNLLAWYNRLLFLLGIKPLFIEMSTISTLVGAGFLKRFIKDPHPVGHIRIFNYDAIRDLLHIYGFNILKYKGAIFSPRFSGFFEILDKLFLMHPKLSSNMIILAQKGKYGLKK